MFDQMSEEFGAMADMEGIPAPPPAFLRAFMQKEVGARLCVREEGTGTYLLTLVRFSTRGLSQP